MFQFANTGVPHFDKALDEAFAKINQGKEREALEITVSALADLAVEPEREAEKRAAIADMRAFLAGGNV